MDDMEIVSALRASLADKVGKERFDLWFGPSTRLNLRGSALTVEVANRFCQDWMRTNFRKDIETCCEAALGQPVSLEFRIDEALAHVAPPQKPSLGIAGIETARTTQARAAEPPQPAAQRRFANFESFVVGATNRVAQASAQMVCERPGCYSPLFLHGPTGVGKTHLLEGIWTATRKARRTASVIYLSAEQFTTYFLEALRGGSGLPSFRRKYRGVDVLIIDDVQFFAGKRATLGELQHTIDTLAKEGRQLVFAADRAPAELEELGPELVARFSGGMVAKLDAPDHATRVGILRQRAGDLKMLVPDDVLDYIATHLTSHARELSGAMNRLHVTSQTWRMPVTREMAEEALAELIRHNRRAPRLADIEKAVCLTFGLEADSLQSGRKAKAVSHPRMLAMWLARKHTRAALSEIGQYFGQRRHSTVISAHKKVGQWVAKQAAVEVADQRLNIEDAIRRVEANLRAG